MKSLIYIALFLCLWAFVACDKSPKDTNEPITAELMKGTWYLIDRGPTIDSTITACERQEYLVFTADSVLVRHQECLPKSDTKGSWKVVDGKCYVRMKISFNSVQISDSTEDVEFSLVDVDKIKIKKQYPLYLIWGEYQKTK